jgi:hydrogenase maturation protease
MDTDLLVIGYGNTLRGDDGVGPRVSDAIAGMALPGVKAITADLLAPELADPISRARRVVFVDASIDTPVSAGAVLRELAPAESSQIMAHAADPRTMLAVARDVFGHAPEAWWLTIPALDMGIGESLSQPTLDGMAQAIEKVRQLALGVSPEY